MTTVRGIHIPASPDAPMRWVDVEPVGFDSWKPYIGDGGNSYVEFLGLGVDGDGLHLDEDGKRKGLPVNERASTLGFSAGMGGLDVIVGDALVVGYDDEGDAADVSPSVTRTIGTLLGEVIA